MSMISRYAAYILFLLLTIFVLILSANKFAPIQSVQTAIHDQLARMTSGDAASGQVLTILIDKKATEAHGAWPWNQDLIADLVAATAAGEPKAVAIDLNLAENTAQDSAGYTAILAGQLQWVTEAVLPFDIQPNRFRSSKTSNPEVLFHNTLTVDNPSGDLSENAGIAANKVFLPANRLLANKPKLGFEFETPDDDRVLRHHQLFAHYEGYYYPSFALATATMALGVKSDQVKVTDGISVAIGPARIIPINSRGEMYLNPASIEALPTLSAADVLDEKFDRSKFKGKAIIIAREDRNENESFTLNVKEDVPSYQITAAIVDNILGDNLYKFQSAGAGFNMLVLFLIGGLCAFLLPRNPISNRMMILGGILFAVLAANYVMFAMMNTLPDTSFILLQILLFAGASFVLESSLIGNELPVAKKAAAVAAKKKAAKLNAKAEASVAEHTPVREIPASQTQSNIPTSHVSVAGKPYPSGGNAQASAPVAESTSATNKDDVTIAAKRGQTDGVLDSQAIDLDDSPVLHNDSGFSKKAGDSGKQWVNASADIKNLGRYQVMSVLGKGAMGLVYKGLDPAINRLVALKTIRLDFVTDPEEMEELKERLFREAQAAGKLSHPNIVTIYDVGSEGNLQYIAMEYLQGQTLEQLMKRKTKFNYKIVAQIISQMCQALEYAHERGIVHRDIKPANIMILPDYSVKIMDYGIARIDSHSMTKTGIAMGTPNYISPEQLKGQATDRRADLFSLGVVMYEMLLQRRPFKGESITSLIYSILNHDPMKPSEVNPEIPLLFDHVIMRALKKDPSQRYQKATEITTDLKDFVASFSNKTV